MLMMVGEYAKQEQAGKNKTDMQMWLNKMQDAKGIRYVAKQKRKMLWERYEG
jgi:hypothetical protein